MCLWDYPVCLQSALGRCLPRGYACHKVNMWVPSGVRDGYGEAICTGGCVHYSLAVGTLQPCGWCRPAPHTRHLGGQCVGNKPGNGTLGVVLCRGIPPATALAQTHGLHTNGTNDITRLPTARHCGGGLPARRSVSVRETVYMGTPPSSAQRTLYLPTLRQCGIGHSQRI